MFPSHYEYWHRNRISRVLSGYRGEVWFILLLAIQVFPSSAKAGYIAQDFRQGASKQNRVKLEDASGFQAHNSVPQTPEPISPKSEPARSVVHADVKTGRLVRITITIPSLTVSTDAPGVVEMIDRIAAEEGVEAPLVHSVVGAESNYNPRAISPKGAAGIMQLEPVTARRFGVSNSFDAEENIRGGVKYLKFLLDYYQGDYTKTVAAYNAGEQAVDRYRGTPPYRETRDYVAQVAKNLQSARAKKAANAPVSRPPNAAETYRPIRTSVGSDGKNYYHTE